MKPTVTVLVDTYNHERFIEEALVSVIEQDFPAADMEIIVVDDGSTDRTPEIIRKFAPRVRLLRKLNGGQASAFNCGIPEARGEIVAFLDGDDWWARNKLARVTEAMASDPEVGIVGHGIIIVHRDGTHQTEILREGFRFRANTVDGAKLFRRRKSLLGTSRMTIRSELLRRIGTVPEELWIEADEFLFTLAAILAHAQILPDVLTFYRMHDANGFQVTGEDSQRTSRKMKVLFALSSALSDVFEHVDLEPGAGDALLEPVRAEATQAKLVLEGGWPWQTTSTEWTLYRAWRPDSSLAHRLFKICTLCMALVLPPRTFYRWRSRIASGETYAQFRGAIFPHDHPKHVDHITHTGRALP